MTQNNDRRRFWRAAFSAPVKVVTAGVAVEAKLDDVSLKGALLEMPSGWHGKAGDHCRLHLRLGGERDEQISMAGHVTHVDGNRIGLACETIDLDSITHLRRLVELNAGDPGLLERELSALVNS